MGDTETCQKNLKTLQWLIKQILAFVDFEWKA